MANRAVQQDVFYITQSQFSLNLIDWYYEGQSISLCVNRNGIKKDYNDVTILHIDELDYGVIKLKTQDQKILNINSNDIVSIGFHDRREDNLSNVSCDNFLYATRTINGFSFDLKNWYYEGQIVDLKDNKKEFYNATIMVVNTLDDTPFIRIKVDNRTFSISIDDITSISYIDRRRKRA